jgi:hypothetical protein
MVRRVFALWSALSLLLCVGTCALWARSYWYEDRADYCFGTTRELRMAHTPRQLLIASSVRGEFGLEWIKGIWWECDVGAPWPGWGRSLGGEIEPWQMERRWPRFRCEYRTYDVVGGSSVVHELSVPTWSLATLLTAPAGLRLFARCHTRRRIRRHLCMTCGYDLRATPQRCPECGAVPQPPFRNIATKGTS